MKKVEYAIVDIETTGGNAGGSRITEIAILIHDGTNVIDRWESLVNPQKDIPQAIFALTGINNAMVRDAPIFDDISEKVLELLTDRVFVAHNVNFDYSFVRHQLKEAGFNWTARKLCTVRASRKILPGHSSYSLGNLCHSLDINLENRHRAGGDADATAVLFSLLLEADHEGIMDKMIKKTAQDQRLPPNLPPQDFEQLPEKPGVYYFYNQEKKVVYVGKAVNIKKRVASHFSGNSLTLQRQNFLRDIHAISFEVCATELMALLLECSEIKKLWPVYNRALKRFEAKFGLYQYEARNGYLYLAVGKLAKFQTCIQTFNTEYEAINTLKSLSEKFGVDYRFCKYGRLDEGVFFRQHDETDFPEMELHNKQIKEAIKSLCLSRPTFSIIDKGRSSDERSCIWVEDGVFYGMGYFSSDIGFSDPTEVRDYVTPYKSNQYIMQLIYSFVEKYPGKIMHH
ncbi:DNA polymerase-3 subunit epsilon [Flavobacterium arsenatis]|uniref:DNA polymerase-3 subunit epsilon n=1 Tax=Flavobacterium arsenatis TaxID=1484332 RepID=A0ABU1TSK3_9FLAO|nr:exonuclease domain-containing protein [Flavobacterium arsenatis]MDR6968817.1 DNA polymerase-3 subunit epsilon [Flavobacterium arsenatis]